MKILVEKVPEGLRLSVTYQTSKPPLVFVVTPAQFETLVTLMRTGLRSESFRFEYQA